MYTGCRTALARNGLVWVCYLPLAPGGKDPPFDFPIFLSQAFEQSDPCVLSLDTANVIGT
jgi:hypothetical protein